MEKKPLFSHRDYFQKFMNTFFPKNLLKLSPRKTWMLQHWRDQTEGDSHGCDKYISMYARNKFILNEIALRAPTPDNSILDLGCNCGFQLSLLKKAGYSNLTGVDICKTAIDFGKKTLDLNEVVFIPGSFEEVLIKFVAEKRRFDLIYSMGATVELVHPSFDIIRYICESSNNYVILGISEWGHAYPRFWEYEFNTHGFALVKCIRPIDGTQKLKNPKEEESLLVFQKIF
jgi:SAM-dependent methyltransferase